MKVVLCGLFILLLSLLKVFSDQGQFRTILDLPLFPKRYFICYHNRHYTDI